jgi:hypothetical protein
MKCLTSPCKSTIQNARPGFSGVRVIRSLVLCACFVDRCLSFCPLSFAIMLSVLRRFMDSDYLPLVSSNSCSYMMPYLTGVATQSVVFPCYYFVA